MLRLFIIALLIFGSIWMFRACETDRDRNQIKFATENASDDRIQEIKDQDAITNNLGNIIHSSQQGEEEQQKSFWSRLFDGKSNKNVADQETNDTSDKTVSNLGTDDRISADKVVHMNDSFWARWKSKREARRLKLKEQRFLSKNISVQEEQSVDEENNSVIDDEMRNAELDPSHDTKLSVWDRWREKRVVRRENKREVNTIDKEENRDVVTLDETEDERLEREDSDRTDEITSPNDVDTREIDVVVEKKENETNLSDGNALINDNTLKSDSVVVQPSPVKRVVQPTVKPLVPPVKVQVNNNTEDYKYTVVNPPVPVVSNTEVIRLDVVEIESVEPVHEEEIDQDVPDRETFARVYLYENRIDTFGTPDLLTGNVKFMVVNVGTFNQYFSINGVKDFGKVCPGQTLLFESKFSTEGEYVLESRSVLGESSFKVNIAE